MTDSISPLPLHKTLILLEHIRRLSDEQYTRHELLALARAVVSSASNLRFGPEVGVGQIKADAPVVEPWLGGVGRMASDLRLLRQKAGTASSVHCADARQANELLAPESIDAVITSPPYPNEKAYTRTTRLESVILGLLHNKADLKALKQGLLRSNTRNVYKRDDDDQWATAYPEVQRLAEVIEAKRIELGKTSGFEKLYGRVTKLYFGGMARHLAALRPILRPGALLAYVVGDQASYLQVMIRTGQILADIAIQLGYELVGIDLFRTRWATATKAELREEVVILQWKGVQSRKGIVRRAYMPKKKNASEGDNGGELGEPIPFNGLPEAETPVPAAKLTEYDTVINEVFKRLRDTQPESRDLPVTLKFIKEVAAELHLEQENPPDIPYTYGSRAALPQSILNHGNWAIEGAGKGKYRFIRLNRPPYADIPKDVAIIRILDSTPQIVLKYQGRDEQSLLARVRYNRLLDTFTSLTTYHLQGHLRSSVRGIGQVEMDDLYIGIDTDGDGYILPVEAKSDAPRDQLGVVQITQMVRFAKMNFPGLKVRPIGVKVLPDGSLLFLEFNDTEDVDLVATRRYKRYLLYREK